MYLPHKKILETLKTGDFSLKELAEITGYSPDGIRGRVSEIKGFGYNIKRVNDRYHLIDIKTEDNVKINVKKILDFVEQYQLYEQRIRVEKLMSKLGLSRNEIDEALSKIYSQGRLLQWKKDVVLIYNI